MHEFYSATNLTGLEKYENTNIMDENQITIHTVYINETKYGYDESAYNDFLQGFILISFCVIGMALCYLCGKTHDYITERYYTNQIMAIYEYEVNRQIDQIINDTIESNELNNENEQNNV
tara:strand:+ start:184 stop:543 length:360 start_codon:yes stop_codon:yes gene_type:complete